MPIFRDVQHSDPNEFFGLFTPPIPPTPPLPCPYFNHRPLDGRSPRERQSSHLHAHRHHTDALPVLGHQQIRREVLNKVPGVRRVEQEMPRLGCRKRVNRLLLVLQTPVNSRCLHDEAPGPKLSKLIARGRH